MSDGVFNFESQEQKYVNKNIWDSSQDKKYYRHLTIPFNSSYIV